ncbi:MAG TPA: PhzF family phenazine biosynthesis protein [Steroidobacteraceae bacterium]|jgi:PhzF family phenazine biosynthesis protein|nr:PhzF family phenazine biosynthesis protein [Steroidobacteraceae bacterium]
MASLTYRLVNVFTRGAEALSGNPLCVFESGAALDDKTMQALARQFNLSETTFILPSSRASAHVRIFTPSFEMAFAGHPTLGTAHVCRALGLGGDELTLEMTAGVIPVSAAGSRWTLQANVPRWREVTEPRVAIALMLGLEPPDIGERPLWVSTGREQLIVPLTSEDAVRRARPQPDALGRFASEEGANMAYVFAPRTTNTGDASPADAETRPELLLARFFFPQGPAVVEDPATGSATANLGGWCIALGRPLPCRFEISQGEQAQRPSTLYLDVDADQRVRVSGDVIELARGILTL